MIRPRRALLLALAVLAPAGLGACSEKQDPTGPPAQRAITVALDGPANVNHVGLLTARDTGELQKAGLQVTLRPTAGPAAALEDLLAGRADLALTSEQTVIAARDAGRPVLSVAAVVQEPLAALVTVDGDSARPADLRGERVGTDGSDYAAAVLEDVVQSAGVDPATVRRVDLPGSLVAPLVRGRVDASLGPFWNIDVVRLRLQEQRPRLTSLDRAGIPPYDEVVLVARGPTVQRDGALVRRFIQALQRGTRTARTDRRAALDALRAADPELPARAARAQLNLTLPLLVPPEATRPFGWQDYQEWQDYADWMTRADLITRPIDAGDVLTNEFLPGEGVGDAGSGPQAG